MPPTPDYYKMNNNNSESKTSEVVVLSDPVIDDIDYVPGPGPGLGLSASPGLGLSSPSTASVLGLSSPSTSGLGPSVMKSNPLVLPPKKASPPLPPPSPLPFSVTSAAAALSPSPSESLSTTLNGYYPSVPLNGSVDEGSSFTSTFLRGILTSLDSKDPVVSRAWLETLLDALDLLPAEAVLREVAPVAAAKGQLERTAEERRAACRLVAKVATRLDANAVRQELLPTALSLCQDPDSTVRLCMCRHLAPLARGAGADVTRSALLPQLVELSCDEDAGVRLAAVEAVAQMLQVSSTSGQKQGHLLDEDARTNVIVPLVIRSCEQSRQAEDESLPAIAHFLGRLCHGLSGNLSQDQRRWMVDFYKRLSVVGTHTLKKKRKVKKEENNSSDDDAKSSSSSSSSPPKPMPDLVPELDHDKSALFLACRRECAGNLPAMVVFAGGAKEFSTPDGLRATLVDLACDGAWQVRRVVAAGLHELARILGPAFCTAKTQVCNLFADDRVEVLEAMVSNLVHVVDALARHGVLQFAGGSSSSSSNTSASAANAFYSEELSRALLKCESLVAATRDWRLHADCLEKFSCLANCLSPATIQGRFVPTLFERILKARPLPCRAAAVRTLLVIMRFTLRSADRQRIADRLRRDLLRGRSCHSRMLFLRACDMAASLFSRDHFKRNFLDDFLSLSSDPVANIRLKLCSSLPKFKSQLSLPSDKVMLRRMEETVRVMLATESDRDVMDALRSAIEGMDAVDTRVDGVPSMNADEDREDERKLREERLISSMEEQLGRIAAAASSSTDNSPSKKYSTPTHQPPVPPPQRQRSDLEAVSSHSSDPRRRSESLPPALKGRIHCNPNNFLLAKSTRLEPPKPQHFSSADLSDLLSSSWQNQYKDDKSFESSSSELESTPKAPYSSSLENLDPSAKEFLVDAGVTLDVTSFSSMPNLAGTSSINSSTKVTTVLSKAASTSAVFSAEMSSSKIQQQQRSASASSSDFSQFLISNEEMKRYEEEYQRASEEISSQVRIETKRRGRPESRLRPPSGGGGGRIPQKNGIRMGVTVSPQSSPTSSSSMTSSQTALQASVTSLPRFSTQSKLSGSTDKIQESIERMSEKWEAKRKVVVPNGADRSKSETKEKTKEEMLLEQQRKRQLFHEKRNASVDTDAANSHIRAAIMEQRLQTIKHQGNNGAIVSRGSSNNLPQHITQQGKRLSLTDHQQFGLNQQLGRDRFLLPPTARKSLGSNDDRANIHPTGSNREEVDEGSVGDNPSIIRKHPSPFFANNNTSGRLASPLSPPPPAPTSAEEEKKNVSSSGLKRYDFPSSSLSPPRRNPTTSGDSVMSMLVQSPSAATSSSLIVKPVSNLRSNSGIAVMSGNRRAAPPPPAPTTTSDERLMRAIPPPPQTPTRPRPPPPPSRDGNIPSPNKAIVQRGQTSPRAPMQQQQSDKEIANRQLQPPPYQRPPQYRVPPPPAANNVSLSDIRSGGGRQINQRRESIPVPPPPAPSSPPPPSPPPPPTFEMQQRRGGGGSNGGQVSINAMRPTRVGGGGQMVMGKVAEPISSPPRQIMQQTPQQQGRYGTTKLANGTNRYRTSLPQTPVQQQQQQQQQQRRPLSHQDSTIVPQQRLSGMRMEQQQGGRNKSVSSENVVPQYNGMDSRINSSNKRLSHNSDGSSRSSSPNSSGGRSGNSFGGGGGSDVALSPDSLDDDSYGGQKMKNLPTNPVQRGLAASTEQRKSSGLRMWQGQQQASRGRGIPQPSSGTNFQQQQPAKYSAQPPPALHQPVAGMRQQQDQIDDGVADHVSNSTQVTITATSNLTRGRPMVSSASKLKRPLARPNADGQGNVRAGQTAAATTPLTQTTKRLYQRNSVGSSAPNSPVKAAIIASSSSSIQRQQHQQGVRQKASSAHNSPGVSRSTSPHLLQQQQRQQQQHQMRRRSANFVAEPPEPSMAYNRQQGLQKMSYQHHRSQPQLTSYQQQQQQQQPKLQQPSRQLQAPQSVMNYQQYAGNNKALGSAAMNTRVTNFQHQRGDLGFDRSRIAAPVPNNTEGAGRPRSFGLPAPGFASSSSTRGYIQKSM